MADPERPIAADSSSLILLQKCGMLEVLMCHYEVWVSGAVFGEIATPDKDGAEQLAKLFAGRQVDAEKEWLPDGMDRGEGETIALHLQGAVEFILVDDKQAAGFCRKKRIPFINSLLLPRILGEANLLSAEISDQAFSRLMCLGYYSDSVIDRARKLSPAALKRFFPL